MCCMKYFIKLLLLFFFCVVLELDFSLYIVQVLEFCSLSVLGDSLTHYISAYPLINHTCKRTMCFMIYLVLYINICTYIHIPILGKHKHTYIYTLANSWPILLASCATFKTSIHIWRLKKNFPAK